MRPYVKWLAVTTLLAGCQTATAPEEARDLRPELMDQVQHLHSVQRVTFTDVISDPCTGQAVAIEGKEQHIQNYTTTDPTKGYLHVDDAVTASGTGIRADGVQYVFHYTVHFTGESPNFPAPQTDIAEHGSFTFISKGSASNFVEHAVFHLMVLPSGEFKFTTEFDSAECRG